MIAMEVALMVGVLLMAAGLMALVLGFAAAYADVRQQRQGWQR